MLKEWENSGTFSGKSSILIGAVFGVLVALVFARFRDKGRPAPTQCEAAEEEAADDSMFPAAEGEGGERA